MTAIPLVALRYDDSGYADSGWRGRAGADLPTGFGRASALILTR